VYVLQGYAGQLDRWLARSSFEPTYPERLDALFDTGDCPDALVVFVDAWTSLGGSQFLNSPATGRYMDYLCDEVVPFVEGRYPASGARAVAGHSSGGYGAAVSAMLRPDVFHAFASHAGDSLFEATIQRDFAPAARALRDHFDGSYAELLRRLPQADPFDFDRFGVALSVYAYAAAYSPDGDRPGEVLLPFEIATGRLVPEVWERWLERDPVRMAARHADALRGLRRIYLDAGRGDEYFLDLGTEALAAELRALGVPHTCELFDGGHSGIAHRYPGAVRELVTALSA
jgi:S-formylglutathione hydrolase FrmB